MSVLRLLRHWINHPWLCLADVVPARLAYWCYVRLLSDACGGKYSGTSLPELTALEAGTRFARIHGFPGNGSDEHYDSNRVK